MSAFLDAYVQRIEIDDESEQSASISSLPVELHNKFSRMRELDQSCQELQQQLAKQYATQLETLVGEVGPTDNGTDALPPVGPRPNPHLRQGIESSQKACLRLSDEKVTLATEAYDLVDLYVQRLDADLHRLHEELKQAATVGGEKLTSKTKSATPKTIISLDEDRDASGNRSDAKAEGGAKSGVEGEEEDGEKGGRKSSRRAQTNQSQGATSSTRQSVDLELLRELDLPVDPNEPTYCVCNQVSFGEMIACDNEDCKIEWFHYECVGITELPKGKWYCADCKPQMHQKKRGKK